MPDADVSSILVRPCPDPKFGDYQSNALMGLAKRNQLNPRELAAQVVGQLDVADCCEPVEIAGPGYGVGRISWSWLIFSPRNRLSRI